MSFITLTPVPSPPSEYSFRAENGNLTVGELRSLIESIDSLGKNLNDFKLVNSGHGNYTLRKLR